jgi:hypothetical protein
MMQTMNISPTHRVSSLSEFMSSAIKNNPKGQPIPISAPQSTVKAMLNKEQEQADLQDVSA